MSDLKISQLPALSGSDLASADQLAVVDSSASQTSRLTVGDLIANGVTLISDNTIPGAKILFDSGSIVTAALADSGVTAVKIASDAIIATKIADNVIVALAATLPTSGGYIGQLALDTDDNSLYVWSGTTWLPIKAPGSVSAFADSTAGIINISTTISSGTATVTASIDNTASAAQFLAGPVGSGGTVGYRTINGGDLPTATSSAKGGVIVNGGGLTLSTDTIQIDNTVTASSVKHLVTYDSNGLVTGGSVISSSDLPVATSSAKGAVIVSDGLAIDASGNLSIDNTVTSGTYTKVTVTSKGVVSSGDTLAAADIPNHSAAKLTSGTIGSSLIANDAITAEKLANESTVKFGGALGSDNVTIFPSGDFKGQLFWDETSLDLYLYSGSAFIPITVLSGNLVNAGTYNASSNLVSSVTTAGSSAGFTAGSALPAPVGANLNHYVVVDTSGTGSGAAPSVALAPPDMLLSQGVGSEYSLIDVSNAIAGQTASNISFIASGAIAATNVQAALQEVDTEKLPKAGGTMTGNLNLGTSTNVVFEGSSADDHETTLTVTNPTADRTITLPNVTGTVVTTGDTGTVSSGMITDNTIVNGDISTNAEIAVSKLANGTARQLLQTDSGGAGVEFTSNVDVPGTLDVTSAATFDSTVAVTGLLSANGKLAYPAGTAAAVSLYSGSDTDTGIYSPGSNQFGIATAGTSRSVVDASGKVGIGTLSSLTPLDVVGSGDNVISRFSNGTRGLEIAATSTGGSLQTYNATQSIDIKTFGATGSDINFSTNNTLRMRIDSSGNVGIGNTSMFQHLEVGFTDNNATFQGDGSSGNWGSGSRGVLIQNKSTTTGSKSLIQFRNNSSDYFIGTENAGSASKVIFKRENNNPDLTIDSSGNVGIGTKFPTQKLDVRGDVYVGDTVGIGTTNPATKLVVASSDSTSADMRFQNSTTGYAANNGFWVGINNNETALLYNYHNSDMMFATNDAESMRIDSSGNVGINNSSPSSYNSDGRNLVVGSGSGGQGLSIASGSSNYGTIYFADGTSGDALYRGAILYNHASDFMRFDTAAGERMRIDSSGNLKLRHTGKFILTEGTTNAFSIGTNGANGDLTFRDEFNTSDRITLTHTGDVLIGTSVANGSYRLAINDAGDNLIAVRSDAAADNTSQALDFGVGTGTRSSSNLTGVIQATIHSQSGGTLKSDLTFFANAGNSITERMRIDSAGQVNVFAGSTVHISRSGTGAGSVQWLYAGAHSATSTSTGTISFQVYTNGNVQNTNDSYGQISDIKLKENIVDAGSQWEDFKAVRFRKYNFKEETGHETHTQLGVIAQELELTSPGLVYETADKDEDGNDLGTTTKAVKSSILTKKALVALQEAMARIEQLETKVAALEAG